MLADPADGQKVGWITDSERMGSPGGRVCETLRGLRSVFCSQSARRRLRTGRAHVFAWGTPLSARFAFGNAQGEVMAARVVGIRQEGESLPDGAVQEGRGTRYVSSCHDVTGKVQGARAASCRAGAAQNKMKISWVKQASLSGEQDSRGRGERPPVWGTG